MKFAIALVCLLALVSAAPQNDVQVVSYENDNIGLGDYKFSYELSDGTKRQEKGQLKNAGTENEAISVEGSYSWTAPDGIVWTVTFIADENGFHPEVKFSSSPQILNQLLPPEHGIVAGGGISGPLIGSLLG